MSTTQIEHTYTIKAGTSLKWRLSVWSHECRTCKCHHLSREVSMGAICLIVEVTADAQKPKDDADTN